MRRVVALVFALAAATACVPTARTPGPYAAKAVKTADAVRSAIESDLLVLDAVRKGHTLATYVSVATSDAEDHASSAGSTFLSIQPPDDRSDQLRDDLSTLLNDAEDVLGDARIAGRRGDRDALLFTRAGLRRAADELDRFSQAHGG